MKKLLTAGFIVAAFAFQFCSGSKKVQPSATVTAAPAKITYAGNIAPLISLHCGPCHISNAGNKKPYDNYANTMADIDDIISRISKNPGERGFMPVRHPKLADSTIQVFASWKTDGLLEK